ncbi:MAG: NAD(P)H-dependent oxidoreductase [Cyanobacteria bacterium J06626_18]
MELRAADVLLLTTPIYNFSIPGALKAYIDLVCRPRLTFRYTEEGPVGLLDCRAYLVITSAGTPIDSEVDFSTPYLRHILGFMGIDEVVVIGCDGLQDRLSHRTWQGPAARRMQVQQQIDRLVMP